MVPELTKETMSILLIVGSVVSAIISFVISTLFYHKGKAWFGSSTHPAALFLLAAFATFFCFMFIPSIFSFAPGPFAGALVAIAFFVNWLVAKQRRKGNTELSSSEVEDDSE